MPCIIGKQYSSSSSASVLVLRFQLLGKSLAEVIILIVLKCGWLHCAFLNSVAVSLAGIFVWLAALERSGGFQ